MNSLVNPYAEGDERHAIWELAVRRDIEAFVAGDWPAIAGDFVSEGFFGVDAAGELRPYGWKLTYPTLDSYRDRWLEQSAAFRARRYRGELVAGISRALEVARLEVDGNSGILLKRFDGQLELLEGGRVDMKWESFFVLRKRDGGWKVAAFVGYLPL